MQTQAVSPTDRAGAVADAFGLASAGQVGMDVALGLASKLRDDPDNLVRQVVVSCLVDLLHLYSEVWVCYCGFCRVRSCVRWNKHVGIQVL